MKGISYDSLLDRQLARLSGLKENRNLTAEELQELAYDETIAEMSETMLTDTDAAQRVSQELYKKDRTLWEKIKDFFTGLVEKLKNAYKGVDPDSDIGRVMKRAISDNEKVAQAWAEAVVEAGENYQLQDGQKNNARAGVTETGVRYSSRKLSEQIDEIANQTFDRNNHVNYGSTPRALSNILSLPILPMLGTYTHAYTMALSQQQAQEEGRKTRGLNFHDLGWDMVKNIPDMLNHPAAIIKSNTDVNDSRFVVVTNQVDKAGRPVIVAISPKGTGNYYGLKLMDAALLSSYGRNNFSNYVATAKAENRILWISKNNHQNQANPGVQFPNVLLSGDYSNNLSQFKKIVKGEFAGTIFQNTFDNDGNRRFSSRNSQESQVERLARKNEELKAEAEYLRQVVQIQKKGNTRNLRDRESVNAIAKSILESVNAKDTEFGKRLNDFYRALQTEEMDYDTMRERAGVLADRALEHHQAERDGYAQEVLDFLKKRRVSLTDSQIGDAEYTYGSLSEFKKAIKGSIIIDQNSTTSLDQLWQEAAAQFPDRFASDTVAADIVCIALLILDWRMGLALLWAAPVA